MTGLRPRLLLAVWLVTVGAAVPFAIHRSEHLSLGGYAVAGSQSARVNAVLAKQYPSANHYALVVLLWPRKGATAGAMLHAIERVERSLLGARGVSLPRQSREQARFAAGLVGATLMPLHVSVSESRTRAIVRRMMRALGPRSPNDAVAIHLLGGSALAASLEDAAQKGLTKAEVIGFPILLIVLLAIFGSLSAAILPLVLAAVAVLVTGALIYFLSLATQLSVFTVDTASMFGIGVAVDYSLIIVSRVRQELRAGRDLRSARATALATSGRTVVFSGIVVIVSLSATWLIPINTLRSMAAGAIIVVAVSVLASVTLLPTLIDLFGRRWERASKRAEPGHADARRAESPRWRRWAMTVTGHPLLWIAAVACVLVPISIPMFSMRTEMGTRQQLSAHDPTQVGLREAESIEGPGSVGPIYVSLRSRSRDVGRRQIGGWALKLRHRVAAFADVKSTGAVEHSRDGRGALFTVTANVDPESPTAERVVRRVRAAATSLLPGRAADADVGGTSASLLDDKREINDGLLKMITAILLTSFAVLVVVLRSLLLPLKAIVMNLVSVSMSYGVLVIVFQWGAFDGIFDYRSPGSIYALVPPLVLAIVFGLSMDYEIFLLSRIRERWLTSRSPRVAIADGLAASATTISGAALILVSVFAIFVGTGVQTIKELGLGAAVAIGVDATIVRLVLVPATMQLLGSWNWWLPSFIDRRFAGGEELITGPALADSAPRNA